MRAIFAFILFSCQTVWAIDLSQFISDLQTTGVELEVHGIDSQADRFVGTFRSKTDFFDFQHFALNSEDAAILAELKTLKRHDVIFVKGEIKSPSRPFLHITINQLKLMSSWGVDLGPYPHSVQVPNDLVGLDKFRVKVHATHSAGQMLVVDYKGSIFPVLVPQALQTIARDLDRGDLVELRFAQKLTPIWPLHLEAVGLTGLEHMSSQHGQAVVYQGTLTLFPASPQVIFNVFALQKDLGEGITREYTIVFSDPNLFRALREKMQKIWDDSPIAPINDRNKLIKPGLSIKAKGIFNFIDKDQANPQILVDSIDDITITSEP